VSLAIGMEMFAADSQPQLDRWTRGELDAEQMRELYRRDWNMPWYLYRDILLYARSHHIPVIGLNVPRDISRKVAQEGFSALSEAERKRLPDGVTCSVDPAYREFIAQAFAAHVHSEASFLHFCEAQMLWNRGMALNLQRFMARSPGRTVVVLTGTGHAMRRGMPEEFAQATGYSYTVLLPETPELDRTTATTADADYLLLP
ncbi:MAG TPA: ChaN family lipoprotein, partial [Desulfuromonadaceae bacterium]